MHMPSCGGRSSCLPEGSDPEEFLEHTKLELFHDQVFCFTPEGKLIALPQHANVIDFAYAVHTDVGNMAVSKRVQRQDRAFRSSELTNGDEVEVITSAHSDAHSSLGNRWSPPARPVPHSAAHTYYRPHLNMPGSGRRIVEHLCQRAKIAYSDEEAASALSPHSGARLDRGGGVWRSVLRDTHSRGS